MAKKITRRVTYRFRGLDRSASKAVFALESALGLAQRQLKQCRKNQGESPIQELYRQLTPRNRRMLMEYGKFLLGEPRESK